LWPSEVVDCLRHPDDKVSIGLILCRTRNRIVAEYGLRDLAKPVGVVHLVEQLAAGLSDTLPLPRDIEAELGGSKTAGRST
jgi:hypothetical protein